MISWYEKYQKISMLDLLKVPTMSIDLGDIDKIDFRESIRRKLSQNGLKHQRSNRAEMAWGGSLRNLVVQQSFIRVRKKV